MNDAHDEAMRLEGYVDARFNALDAEREARERRWEGETCGTCWRSRAVHEHSSADNEDGCWAEEPVWLCLFDDFNPIVLDGGGETKACEDWEEA